MTPDENAAVNESQNEADPQTSDAHDEGQADVAAQENEPAGEQAEPPIEVTPKMIRKLKDDQLMKLAERAGEADHFRDVAARAQAELENFRKRMERQRQDDARYAIVPIVREILGSLDNLERALAAAKQAGDSGPLLQGVEMTRDLLIRSLDKFGVQQIDAAGIAFDPEVHEAVLTGADPEQEADVILDCFESGWRLHERVIRPAKVRVNKPEG